MKSYFAKLADRATIGSSTASLAMRAKQPRVIEDPIEKPDPEPLSYSQSTALPGKKPSPVDSYSHPEAVQQREELSKTSDLFTPPEKKMEEVDVRVASRSPVDLPRIRKEVEPVKEGVAPLARDESMTHSIEERRKFDENFDDPEISFDFTRFEALEKDQISLLRRADEFMSNLLTPKRHADDEAREVEVENKQETAAISRLQPVSTTRPTFPPPASRTAEDAETPSLVIGKLTVEVSSPAPQAPQSSPIIVVQRGNKKNGAMPSSRRFGLGQF